MEFVEEYVFYKVNIEEVDEIIVKACSDCSYRYIHSHSLRLIFSVKIIDLEDNETKNKVFKFTSGGWFLFLGKLRKKGYKVIKINKLTLRYCGIIDDSNICYRSKLGLPFSPLEIAFYKNIATSDDYIHSYCFPSFSDFTDKCVKWYLYNKTSDLKEYEELWIEYFR